MYHKQLRHQFISMLVALSLLLQMFTPFAIIAPETAVYAAEPTMGNAQSMTNNEQLTINKSPLIVDDSPISLSRVQSSHQAGDAIVVSYTVTNNQLPTLDVGVPTSTNVTDTIAILSSFVITEDMNTLHNTTLETTLTNGTLIDANGAVVTSDTLTWHLDALYPQQTMVVTFTMQAPSATTTFVELDSGAQVQADLWGTNVTAQARPGNIVPDSVDPAYLAGTADADVNDTDMLWISSRFTQDPIAAFEFVRAFAFDPYQGSLRGTRGTLWGNAGNSLDQSSLLIAMLRASGVPARYRHGSLSTGDAQTLIASMFDPIPGAGGYLPAGTVLADPLNDAELLALAQDHWWVEAYLPSTGAWTDLDPTFPTANIGDSFATPGANDRIAAVPASEQHTIELSLRVEQYTEFPLNGTNLITSYPLTVSLPIAQVAAKQLIFSHISTDETLGGMVFATRQINYQPYFGIEANDFAVLGDSFDDLFSNFPLTTHATVAAWIEYTLTSPTGEVEQYERVIKDSLGPDVRLYGGTPDLAFGTDSPPFLAPGEEFVHWILPNSVPDWAYERQVSTALPILVEQISRTEAMFDLRDEVSDPLTVEQNTIVRSAISELLTVRQKQLTLGGLQFAHSSDSTLAQIADGLHTKLFYSSPRVFALYAPAPTGVEEQKMTVDLRTTQVEAIVAPGQAATAGQTAQWLKGVSESQQEGDTLENLTGEPVITTERTFAEMNALGIPPVLFTLDDIDQLTLYPYSSKALAYMSQALLAGKTVIAPSAEVPINDEVIWTWWEIDPETGETISAGENGLHVAALGWTMIKLIVESVVEAIIEFMISAILSSVGLNGPTSGPGIASLAEQCMALGQALNEIFMNVANAFPSVSGRGMTQAQQDWLFLPAHVCPINACGIEQFMLDGINNQPIPLPHMLFSYQNNEETVTRLGARIDVTDNGGGGDPMATLNATPSTSTISADESAVLTAVINANFTDTFDLLVYAPDGWHLTVDAGGTITATPREEVVAGDYTLRIVAQAQGNRDVVITVEHNITVTTTEAFAFGVSPEPYITIPQNNALYAATTNQTNDGEAEIPDSAYHVEIKNQSTAPKTFTVDVTGAPAGWIVLDGMAQTSSSVTLPPGAVTTIGLYIIPDALPAPGTSHTIDVAISDGGSLTDNAQLIWTMPGQAHNFMQIEPQPLYLAADGSASFDLTMQNVGNMAGTFPITATTPISTWNITGLPASITLDAAANDSVAGTLTIVGGEVGREYPLTFASSAPDGYTQYALTTAVIVSPLTSPIFSAANSCTLNSDALSASFESLAFAVNDLASSCSSGNCDLAQRDAAVEAANSAAQYARVASRDVSYAALETIAADMATHTTAVDLDADMEALGTAVGTLSTELCDLEGHQPIARFTPYVDAILLGDSSSVALDVTNSGTLSTTYAITVTGLPDGDQFFNETINAGAMVSLPINSTPATLGAFDVEATVTAVGSYTLTPETTAVSRLNVVDKFLQVTQVTADPAFVETGVSSTTISVEIANIAGVAWPANAKTAVFAANNSTVFTVDTPITTLAGTPRWYELATVDSSGWAEGVYTVTVELLDDNDVLIPDGNGYGYFSVGQAIVASHALQPDVVALGTVTVTTMVTTAMTTESIIPTPLRPQQGAGSGEREAAYSAEFLATLPAGDPDSLTDGLPLDALYLAYLEQVTMNSEQVTMNGSQPITQTLTPIHVEVEETAVVTKTAVVEDVPDAEQSPLSILNSQLSINNVFTRTEQDDPAVVYSGTWTNYNTDRASGGNYYRADDVGETAVFTFTGDWLNIGFITSIYSGHAEVSIDGASQGVIDLYRKDETAVSYLYDGLIDTTHTVTVTVLGTNNSYAYSDRVQLDYFDAWDSSSLPDGTFEQNDQRVIASTGWTTITTPIASGGSYIRDNVGTVWFPFTGDSFSYHAIDTTGINHTQLLVDGRFLTDLNSTNFDTITHTYSYDGFGAGPHILQISGYRGNSHVDAFTTPAIASIDSPELTGSYIRYEEDNHNWLYSGVPYTQTAQTWTRREYGLADIASDDQAMFSNTMGETAVITVNGEWINIGFAADSNSGHADIYLDGAYQRTIDLYRNDGSVTSALFPALSAGAHTISVTVVGDGYVWIDYVDVWDGTALPDGTYETFPGQFYLSPGWSRINDTNAINGNYLRTTGGTAWFPFTGDSVSYRAFAYNSAEKARLYLDDQFIGTLDLFSSSDISRTFSFDGLGSGAHILRLEDHHGNITLEDFTTPGTAPFYSPPVPTGIIRYEEDNPALRYNGLPLTQTVASWDSSIYKSFASDGYYADSNTMGDSVSLDFNGTWVGVGFLTWRTRGIADIYLDGNLIDTVDLFTHKQDTKSVYYNGLADTAHTISITVSGNSNPHATGTEIAFDYIDVWDGTLEADGVFEETAYDRIIYSFGWAQITEADASGGGYADTGISGDNTAWFPFTGDSISYQAWSRRNTYEMEIKIDGVNVGQNGQDLFDIFADVPISRTFSFDGLGAGPHVMEINKYRADITLDSITVPGIAPFYTAPDTPTGIVRYEEDDPALLYNGYPFEQSPYCSGCWFMSWDRSSSNAYIAESRQPGEWVELTFDGSWAGVGFATGSYGGVAEVFIDGTSMTTITLNGSQDVTSVYFGDLITGTHTISVSNQSGRLYFDFFDTWDGTAMGDGWFDADLDEHNGPYYYSALDSWYTLLPTNLFAQRIQYAYDDDVLDRATISYNTHLWFGFTGNDLEFLPFQKAGDTVELFIDGISQGVIDLTPEYSDQPIALYYTDLGEGPHMVHLDATDSPRIDAFQVNPPNLLPYTPQIEWMDAAPTDVYTTTFANGGMLSSSVIGDLDGDGLVEIVSPSSNGQLYVYRGDGLDAGGGSPLLWQSDLVGMPAEPALADLDGDGKAEIIVMGSEGTAVFHHDGSLYWFTDTIKSEVQNLGWGGASIANLDLEPSPEIVLAANGDALYVLDHDGTILFSEPTGQFPAIPTLADVTGDGFLDIIFAQDKTITAYDAFNGYNIAWTRTHTYAGFYGQAFGSPVVVDVDGKQPGGDDGPEVVINWGNYVDVLDADGSFLWNYAMGSDSYYRPSPITVADIDGDNEIELLTASAFNSGFLVFHHLLVALNADGTLLWSNEMGDTTASASGVSTQDLDGDGVWEVLWNGYNEGFTIMDGPTGERLFNEEVTESGTVLDYPVVGDVDGDGYAELVTGGQNGLFVIGFDGVWGESRPLWNQHNYHVTNINDDWSVPVSEPNSWDIHNTYRTQTPDNNPTPAYQINLTYTAGIDNITVLTPTASISLTGTPPTYTWNYHQEWYQPVVTTTFDSVLTDMKAGETRLVAEGTQIAYRLPSGYNYLTLPPLYVTAPHIVAIDPGAETVWAGLTAVYTITLTNPAANADTYVLSISGVPSDWVDAPASVPIDADSVVTVPITVTVPPDAAIDTLPIIADVTNGNGGTDAAIAYLSIGNALQIGLDPAMQSAYVGVPVSYTLTISNVDGILHSYTLTATGLADVSMPASIDVLGGGQESVTIQATATAAGEQPFTIQVMADNGIGKSVDGVVEGLAVGVELALAPDPVVTGAGSTAVFTLTVTNNSDTVETFDLIPSVPAGWDVELTANGTAVNSVTLTPDIFNSTEFLLLVTPDAATVAADYEVMVTAVSQNAPDATASISGTVEVLPLGVQIAIVSGPTAVDPLGSATWQVEVTNHGTTADTFDLQLAGVFALTAQLSTDVVTLAAGQSQTVQATTSNLSFLLPGTLPLVVAATSQADSRVQHQDRLDVTVDSFEGVEIGWQPASKTVTDTLTAGFTLLISNTGNVATTYTINLNTLTTVDNAIPNTITIPAHSAVILPVMVAASGIGTHTIEATVSSESGVVSGAETAVLIVADNRLIIYLPVILK